jgi:pilus assembly protein CpaC
MRNNNNGTVDRTPGAGSVPVLGALFRSQSYRRNETELVIIVTPYLVEPVNANDIALPTDGYQAPNDIERILLGKLDSSKSGVSRPKPTMAPSAGPISAGVQGAQLAPIAPPESASASNKPTKKQSKATKVAAAPGFSGN